MLHQHLRAATAQGSCMLCHASSALLMPDKLAPSYCAGIRLLLVWRVLTGVYELWQLCVMTAGS